ncbi:hypothetical protein [Halomonas sp. IOP_31]|uniref:hypothetical protein n=1 Tax=Halomonas sp. IOP_31 TaxID=2876584 RepID=UPI001E3D62D0|nr:hypothetical protein [Halomonas sp. IOP_31]MCD6006892.1 hypothetical protein [Halomonas sp. IOP_31]
MLERHYRSMNAAEIQRRFLPHRTLNAIRNTAVSIKAGKWPHRRWSDSEVDTLRMFYSREGPGVACRLEARTPAAVRAKAMEEGLSTRWTEQDIEILRRKYPVGGIRAAASELPDKSRVAIRSQARSLGLRYKRRLGDGTSCLAWTEEEIERLKEHQNIKFGDLCRLFPGRSKVAIKTMRQRLRRGRSDQAREI